MYVVDVRQWMAEWLDGSMDFGWMEVGWMDRS